MIIRSQSGQEHFTVGGSMIRDLLKRSSWHLFGLIGGKVVSTLAFILLARSFAPAVFGQILLFITFVTLSNTLGSFGLNQWYQKQKAVNKKKQLFGQVIEARFLSMILAILVVGVWIQTTSSFSFGTSLILLAAFIPESFLSIIEGYYLVKKQPIYLVISNPLKMAFMLVPLLITSSNSLELILIFYTLASFIAMLWLFPWNQIKSLSFSIKRGFKTLADASHYALLLTTSYAYSRGDQLIIRYTLSEAALGIYGSAYRYLESLSLLPSVLSQNLFHLSAQKNLITKGHMYKILSIMTVLGIVTGIGLFLSAELLTTSLLGVEYQSAAALVKIFSGVVFLFFVNAPLATLVQSSDFLKSFLPWGIFNTVSNLALNILLIPMWGLAAAAWIMIFSEVFGLCINLFFIRKLYRKQ